MQKSYIEAIMDIAESDPSVMFLTADNGTDFDGYFKRDYPDQFMNVGIAEENLVGMAAGLSMAGIIPFIQTGSAFFVYRANEFLRNDICMQNLNVKLIGTGAGLTISTLGSTHHSTEDIGILRMLPNLKVLSPMNPEEVRLCVRMAYETKGPVYIRVDSGVTEDVLKKANEEKVREGIDVVSEGNEGIIISVGGICEEAYTATKKLQTKGIDVTLLSIKCLKPFPIKKVLPYLYNKKWVVTVEEHSIYCGIGGIIAEIIAENLIDIKLLRVGLKDQFAHGYGSIADLRRYNLIDADYIEQLCLEAINE